MNELLGGDAALRRALHAAAEQVDPVGDGLDKIRARVRHRQPMPLPIAWVDIALTKLSLRVPDGVWVAWDRMAHEVSAASRHFLPGAGGGRGVRSSRSWLGWARPIAAMSTATFLVAAVVYTAIEVPAVMSTVSGPGLAAHNAGGPQPSSGSATSAAGQALGHPQSGPIWGPIPIRNPPNSAICTTKPTARPTITTPPPASTSPTPPPSTTPPPTPTPTSSPTSPSPTPTPSDSGSTAPTGTGSSPSDGSQAPADPGSGATGQLARTASKTTTQGSTTTPRSTGGAKAHTISASPSPTPCVSPKSKPSPSSSTVKVHPEAAGSLTLWADGAGLVPADVRAKLS